MIKVNNINVFNFEGAIRGMRNPMNSWDKSDSGYFKMNGDYYIGENDLDLMRRLYKAGTEHRKYLRQIFVSMDIIAPDYWFKEFSTYKIGIVENSTSTMHKIVSKKFELTDFSFDYSDAIDLCYADCIDSKLDNLNYLRDQYLKTKDNRYWRLLIQELPMAYIYRRSVTMNYENVVTIIKQRTGHKLEEWGKFVKILKDLPYIKEIITNYKDK